MGLLSHDAWSWGFGRAQSSAVLGASLDFVVGLRLEAGEAPPECLSAEVTVGDVPLPRSAVSVSIESASGAALVRVRTLSAIDEPLVLVNLSAGCSSRIARRFTLLADPPGHLAAPALASVDTTPVAVSPAIPVTPAAAATPTTPSAMTPAPVQPVPSPAPPPAATAAADRGAAGAAASPGPGRAGTDAQGPTPKAPPPPPPRPRNPDPSQLADAKAAGPDKAALAPAARPRLQLDAPVIAAKPPAAGAATGLSPALKAAEEAASAARAAASAAESRALALERNLEALRQEAKANREALARLTQALKDAQGGGVASDNTALWGALAGLAALSLFLLFRQRRLQQGAGQAPWWSASSAAGADSPAVDAPAEPPAAAVSSSSAALPTPAFLSVEGPAPSSADAPPAPWTPEPGPGSGGGDLPPLPMPEEFGEPIDDMERTRLLPPSASSVSAPISSVSIEELLDLEQQVEFFTVLGQDESALSLLVEHLRSTGGTYPLPYLKLLEIYRRKGDEESYERTRDRFNQRFNAVAPAWGAAPSPDRHLEDVPEVLERIQQAWPRPVDAMALLENMLVRTEGGTLLELTALGEVLFLFTLARDLHEQEVGGPSDVDVLLPFDDMFASPTGSDAPARDDQPTLFSPSAFGGVSRRGAAGAAAAGLVTAAAAAQEEVDHFDLPLGEPMFEPMFEPVFDPPAAAPVSRAESSDPGLAFRPAAATPNIDLPMFDLGGDPPTPAVPAGPSPAQSQPAESFDPLGSLGALEPLELDLSFEDASEPSPATAGSESARRAELPSFDLPDLELPQSARAAVPASEPSVDLDISLDGLELAPMAPKLTPSQEQAASNFGLFNETPAPGKPR